MEQDNEQLIESKKIIEAIANGINPLSGESITDESFFNDPRIIRPLFYLSQYLGRKTSRRTGTSKPKHFTITLEEKSCVKLPEGKIGINKFAFAVNKVIDTKKSKKLNGAVINKKLKALGILSEEMNDEGKRMTVINATSEGYGIESIPRTFNNREFQQVVYNETGKKFLLDNIEKIMSYEGEQETRNNLLKDEQTND